MYDIHGNKWDRHLSNSYDDGWEAYNQGYRYTAIDAWVAKGRKMHVFTQEDFDRAREQNNVPN